MIVPMKRLTLAALLCDEEAILYELQKLSCVEVIRAQENQAGGESLGELEARVAKLAGSIKFLSARDEKKQGMLSTRPLIELTELEDASVPERAARTARLEAGLQSARAEKSGLEGIIEQFLPWEGLDERIENLRPTRNVVFLAGFVPQKLEDKLDDAKQETEIIKLGAIGQLRAVFALCHVNDLEGLYEHFRSLQWTDASFPKMNGTPGEIIAQTRERVRALEKEIEALEAQAAELAREKLELLKAHDASQIARDRAQAGQHATCTESAFVLEGWVRADRAERVEEAVKKVTDAYDISFRDPEDGENPPSLVRNNGFVGPFEMITDLYSRPNPRALDPNPTMAPFYMCFFGMMVSDAGYGILLAIGAFLYGKFMRPRGMVKKLCGILVYGGLSTLVWGFLFGGWFGEALIQSPIIIDGARFSPLDQPMIMLVLCFGLGLIHIFFGMGMKMYQDIKAGHPWAALFDTGSWYLLIVGLIFLALPQTATVGQYMAIVGALMLLLSQGREKKGIFSKFTSGLLSLYNITSYLSDVLSYSRLFALGLATGVIGMVMNTLATMPLGTPIIGPVFMAVILIVGHLFNLVINALGAYVHASRLQYIEYFGKFYESGGREFRPLSIKTKYLDIA